MLPLRDTCDTGCEDIHARIYNGRLDGSLTADERALILAARIRHALDERADRGLLGLAADDGVEDGKGSRAHNDDVVDEVIDHIMADGLGVAALHRQLLLTTRFLGLKDQDRLLDLRELDVI